MAAAADPASSLLSMRILFPSSSWRRPRESNHHFPQPAGRKPTYPSFTVGLLGHKRTVRDGLLMFCLTRGMQRMKSSGSRRYQRALQAAFRFAAASYSHTMLMIRYSEACIILALFNR